MHIVYIHIAYIHTYMYMEYCPELKGIYTYVHIYCMYVYLYIDVHMILSRTQRVIFFIPVLRAWHSFRQNLES